LNKLRLLAYISTPSGNQKQGYALFLLSLSNLRYFSSSLKKEAVVKNHSFFFIYMQLTV